MKLNFKGFFKAAGLCSLAFALTGCITWGLVSNTASRPHAEQWRSDPALYMDAGRFERLNPPEK